MQDDRPTTDPLDRPLIGAALIAKEVYLTPAQIRKAYELGHLAGIVNKFGGRLVSTPRKLQQIANGTKGESMATERQADTAA